MKLSMTKLLCTAVLALPMIAGTAMAKGDDMGGQEGMPNAVNCPNLGMKSVSAQVIAWNAASAKVRITAIMENMGRQAFVSPPNKQGVVLRRNGALKAVSKFTHLWPGQRITVTWEENVPLAGYPGVAPVFKASVLYHPSVAADGDPANDDCRPANNHKIMHGSEVNALLH